jgi:hypothetical protein
MSRATRRTRAVVLLALVATVAASGCTVIGRRYGAPVGEAPGLAEGQATAADAVRMLGPPARMSALPGGMVMAYEYIDATERQFGINLELIKLNWFKFAFGRGVAERQALLLLFDDDGVLRARDYQSWSEPLGRGLGFQLFFVAMPTVDTRHLWEAPEQFTWGRRSLDPLMATLNAGQSVTSGMHGIEMRGTPDSVGQRTLEAEKTRRRR